MAITHYATESGQFSNQPLSTSPAQELTSQGTIPASARTGYQENLSFFWNTVCLFYHKSPQKKVLDIWDGLQDQLET